MPSRSKLMVMLIGKDWEGPCSKLNTWLSCCMLHKSAILANGDLSCAVYFVQGILGLSRLGVSFLYKDEFHLEPASVSLAPGCSHFVPATHLCVASCPLKIVPEM